MDKDGPFLAMMPVRNEADRFLPHILKYLVELVDGVVILDDASTDETPELCRKHPLVVSYRRLKRPAFIQNEGAFRKLLWEMTVELKPSWVLALDADEIFETKAKKEINRLICQKEYELIRFPVYHFWGDLTRYRVDGLWNPFFSKIACLYRYNKNQIYRWPERRLHCGRFPLTAYLSPSFFSPIRLLHLGYVDKTNHPQKYQRYLSSDPEGKFCPLSHYFSILNPHPKLRKWWGESLEEIL